MKDSEIVAFWGVPTQPLDVEWSHELDRPSWQLALDLAALETPERSDRQTIVHFSRSRRDKGRHATISLPAGFCLLCRLRHGSRARDGVHEVRKPFVWHLQSIFQSVSEFEVNFHGMAAGN